MGLQVQIHDLAIGAVMGVVTQLLGGKFVRTLLVLPLEWLVRRARSRGKPVAAAVEEDLLQKAKQDLGLPATDLIPPTEGPGPQH